VLQTSQSTELVMRFKLVMWPVQPTMFGWRQNRHCLSNANLLVSAMNISIGPKKAYHDHLTALSHVYATPQVETGQ